MMKRMLSVVVLAGILVATRKACFSINFCFAERILPVSRLAAILIFTRAKLAAAIPKTFV